MQEHLPDEATRLQLACKVISGVTSTAELAHEFELDETTVAEWVSLVRLSGGVALGAVANGRYMSGNFFQLSRLVERGGVLLHSLDRVVSNQLAPDESGASQVHGFIERIVDDIDTEQQRVVDPESGHPPIRFEFTARYQDGKAVGMFWSCTPAHESRGTFILNRYNIAGHALAGAYSRLDFETDSGGNLVSVPSLPAQRQVIWTCLKPGTSWRQYLADARQDLLSAPGRVERVIDFSTELLRRPRHGIAIKKLRDGT